MAVNATAVWRVRPSGSNTNGGGYDPGISGAATDYSQQNTAQATGTLGTASGTTTFTDAGGAFTSAMIGNALQIVSGAGFTPGFYFITAFGSSTSVTLDRSPGTGTVAAWNLGGGWADWYTNSPQVYGNIIYILGSGIPNPAAYTYDYTVTGSRNTNGGIYAGDPSTPSFSTGGRPVIKWNNGDYLFLSAGGFSQSHQNLWIVGTASVAGSNAFGFDFYAGYVLGCVVDQFGFDCTAFIGFQVGAQSIFLIGTEVFSSVVPGAAGSNPAIFVHSGAGINVSFCNIHDCVGFGFIADQGILVVASSIIAKCQKDGIDSTASNGATYINVFNCTIDGNLGNGITISSSTSNQVLAAINNIISNHSQAGKSGIDYVSIPGQLSLADYNVYYNNTTDITGSSYGPHDTHGGSNPYVGQSTENYSLA